MKRKDFIIGIFVAICLSSCAGLRYGASTDVTIYTKSKLPWDQRRMMSVEALDSAECMVSDSCVTIIAAGKKDVKAYKNVCLPFKMKVRHKNLPVRVSIESTQRTYNPFYIEKSGTKGSKFLQVTNGVGTYLGGVSLPLVALNFPVMAPIYGGVFLASYLARFGYGNTTNSGSYEVYSQARFYESDIHKTRELFIKQELQDINFLLVNSHYDIARNKVEYLFNGHPTGEYYYLRGLCHYSAGDTKKAIKDLSKALNYDISEELQANANYCIQEAERMQWVKKKERQQLWTNIASGLLQAGAATFQAYAQAEYLKNMQNSGITSSGVVTDPSKLSQAHLEQLIDPNFAYQQVMQKEYMEYQEFCRYNKKEDGSHYSFAEFQTLKGQALLDLKEQGIDLVAEQREQNRKERQEWREGLEQDRKERLEQAKAVIRGEPYRGTSNTSSSSSEYTSTYTTVTPTITTSATTITDVETDDNLDSKEQFRRESVSSGDYQRVKDVTLYYREGDKAKVMMSNVELCRKGAYYYIKIGSTYYPRRASNWSKYRNAIAYGHHQLYYND